MSDDIDLRSLVEQAKRRIKARAFAAGVAAGWVFCIILLAIVGKTKIIPDYQAGYNQGASEAFRLAVSQCEEAMNWIAQNPDSVPRGTYITIEWKVPEIGDIDSINIKRK